jgi:hypothetical protein
MAGMNEAMTMVAPKRNTQKIDLEPCTTCGATVWTCCRVTPTTPYPWKSRYADVAERHFQDTWPWVGGILVGCERCQRWWYGNASMDRFSAIRELLPTDGTAVRVRFRVLERLVVLAETVDAPRKLARPKRREHS